MSWRLAGAVAALRTDVNARWPHRDKASDGTIGNAEHASRSSDHNPWLVVDGRGVVRAIDIDVDGINAGWLAEQLRLAGRAGDRRLVNGGYVIFNGKITSGDFSGWRVYTGKNRHTSHLHVSFSRDRSGFDDASHWTFLMGASELDATERGWLKFVHDRVAGFCKQRWYQIKKDLATGEEILFNITEAPPANWEQDPKWHAARALDTADGNYLVKRIEALEARLAAMESKI